MPMAIQRHYLSRTLLALVLGFDVLTLPRLATAASSTAPPQQSDAASGQRLPEVTVIGRMDKHTLNHVINQFIQSHAKPSAVIGQVGRWNEIELCIRTNAARQNRTCSNEDQSHVGVPSSFLEPAASAMHDCGTVYDP
jgi:hypothetical protein